MRAIRLFFILKIGLYIDPKRNRWNCFSVGKGGGPIQLIMFLENKTWVESIRSILGEPFERYSIEPGTDQNEGNMEFLLPKKTIPIQIRTQPKDDDDKMKGMPDMALFINNLEIFFRSYIPSITDRLMAILKKNLLNCIMVLIFFGKRI